MVNRVFAFSAHHSRLVFILVALVTLILALPLGRLSIHISAESMMVDDAAERELFRNTRSVFGDDNITLVVFRDEHLRDPEKIKAVGEALRRIEALPFAQKVSSLFTLERIRNVDGTILFDNYLDDSVTTREELTRRWAEALRNPFLNGLLISADGTTMTGVIQLRDEALPDDLALVSALDAALAPLSGTLESAFQVGAPYLRAEITRRIHQDQRELMPLAIAILALTLAVVLRRLRNALLPLLTAGISIVWTLGLMAWLNIPLDVMTSIVPALLVIIGSTEDIHLISAYEAGIASGRTPDDGIRHMSATAGLAVMLTFLTSYLGFLSIATNDIGLLQRFGFVASSGLLFNFLVTVLLVPALLCRYGQARIETEVKEDIYARLGFGLYSFVDGNRKTVLLIGLVILGMAVAGAAKLQVDTNTMGYFDDSAAVKQRSEILNNTLAGMYSIDVVLDARIEGTFLRLRYLGEIRKLQRYLEQSPYFDKSLSFLDFIKFLHTVMDDPDSPELYAPDLDEQVQEYMNFISHDKVAGYVNPDFSVARVSVRHHLDASRDVNLAIDDLRRFVAEKLDPNLDIRITGESVLTNEAADRMAEGQARSLALMLAIIFVIISLLFLNFRAGALAIVPNLFPIVILFGVMGYFGIPLDTSTAMVAAIAVGISVDDTMHFMVRYNQQIGQTSDYRAAIRQTMIEEARPITATSVALTLGFGTLAFSGFPPVGYFGLLSAMVIVLALFANFLITPVLLSRIDLITLWDLLSVRLRHRMSRHSALFYGFNRWQVRKIVLSGQRQRFGTGESIVREGESGSDMYVILHGRVEVTKQADGETLHLKRLYPGQVFGEVALVGNVSRTATVVALRHTEVLKLTWKTLRRIGRTSPFLARQLYLNIAFIASNRLADVMAVKKCDNPAHPPRVSGKSERAAEPSTTM